MVCKLLFSFVHQSLSCGFVLPHDDFGLEIHLHDSGLESFMRGNSTSNTPPPTRRPGRSSRSLKHQTFLVMLRKHLERRQRKGYQPNDNDNTVFHLFREFLKDILLKHSYCRNFNPAKYEAKCPNINWSMPKKDFEVLKNDIIKVLEDNARLSTFLLCYDTLRSIYPQLPLDYLFRICFGEDSKLMKARTRWMGEIQNMLEETKDYVSFRFFLNMYPSLAYTENRGLTTIGCAVRQKDEKKIKILKECLGVSTPMDQYMTPFDILNLAIREGHNERIKSWINSQDKVVLNHTLTIMAQTKQVKWVKYLLSSGADPLFKLPPEEGVGEISLLQHIKQTFENPDPDHQEIISLMEEHVEKSRAIR